MCSHLMSCARPLRTQTHGDVSERFSDISVVIASNVIMALVLTFVAVIGLLLLPFSYVPALRPLRQQAFLLTFPQTQPSRLAQRLAEVSAQSHSGVPKHLQTPLMIHI